MHASKNNIKHQHHPPIIPRNNPTRKEKKSIIKHISHSIPEQWSPQTFLSTNLTHSTAIAKAKYHTHTHLLPQHPKKNRAE